VFQGLGLIVEVAFDFADSFRCGRSQAAQGDKSRGTSLPGPGLFLGNNEKTAILLFIGIKHVRFRRLINVTRRIRGATEMVPKCGRLPQYAKPGNQRKRLQ